MDYSKICIIKWKSWKLLWYYQKFLKSPSLGRGSRSRNGSKLYGGGSTALFPTFFICKPSHWLIDSQILWFVLILIFFIVRIFRLTFLVWKAIKSYHEHTSISMKIMFLTNSLTLNFKAILIAYLQIFAKDFQETNPAGSWGQRERADRKDPAVLHLLHHASRFCCVSVRGFGYFI